MYYLKPIFGMIKPSDIVLDLGCGVGRFTFRLAKLCKEVWGVDSSPAAIEFCKQYAQKFAVHNVKFQVADARELPFSDETFDWVLSVTVLQHIVHENDLIDSIKEILRVTKKGGRIILLECTTDKRKDNITISLPRKRWFEIIRHSGGEIEYWTGIDVSFLRRIIFPAINATKKIKINKLRNFVELGLSYLLKPFEMTIPKIIKNQSWYSLILIKKL